MSRCPTMKRDSQQSVWIVCALVVLMLATASHGETMCDTYSVELQAVFDSDTVIPCTEEETTIVEALIHSLVQTDAIVGLNRMIPVAPFYLAFETFGLGVKRLSSFEEQDFMMTQMQLAMPHMTLEDELEDLYYKVNYTQEDVDDHAHNSTDDHDHNDTGYEMNQSGTGMGDKADGSSSKEDMFPSEDDNRISAFEEEDKLVPPPPVEIADDSLRQGPDGEDCDDEGRRQRKLYETHHPTMSPTPAPTPMASRGLRATPSPTPGPTPGPSPDPTPGPTPSPTSSTPAPASATPVVETNVPEAPTDLALICSTDVLKLTVSAGKYIVECQRECEEAACCWKEGNPTTCPDAPQCAEYMVPCGQHLVPVLEQLENDVNGGSGDTSPTTPAPTPSTTPEPTTLTPPPTPAPTPDGTNATPEPTRTTTPEPTSDNTQGATPLPTPAPTQTTTPEPTSDDTQGATPSPTPVPTPTATTGSTPSPTTEQTPLTTPAPTPVSTPSPTSNHTYAPTDAIGCDADWCAWFITRPCDMLPHDEDEGTARFHAELKAFQRRVEEQIEKKLRKWARDTDVMCLGNSWELKAHVKRLL